MAERISLGEEVHKKVDGETKQKVTFMEKVPIGETSGKTYDKQYVSIKDKGWFVQNPETGEILSSNATIQHDNLDGMTNEQLKRTLVAPVPCPACGTMFTNSFWLEEHCGTAHQATFDTLVHVKREVEEAVVQEQLAQTKVASVPTVTSARVKKGIIPDLKKTRKTKIEG